MRKLYLPKCDHFKIFSKKTETNKYIILFIRDSVAAQDSEKVPRPHCTCQLSPGGPHNATEPHRTARGCYEALLDTQC